MHFLGQAHRTSEDLNAGCSDMKTVWMEYFICSSSANINWNQTIHLPSQAMYLHSLFLKSWMTSYLCEVYFQFNYLTYCIWIRTYILFTIFLRHMYPFFCRDLDPDLQTSFDEYLKARLGGSLLKFLIDHMHRKEQNLYVNWLQKLQETVSKGESSSPSNT